MPGTGIDVDARAPRPPLLDRFINWINPVAGARRARARQVIGFVDELRGRLMRKYEGASGGRRVDSWRTASTSADVEIGSSLTKLRDRSRALARDDAWGRRIVRQWTTWAIGRGWFPSLEDADPRENVWRRWSTTTACDVRGRRKLRALVRSAVNCVIQSGETLLVRRWSPEHEVPVSIAVYEPDYLDDSMDGDAPGGVRDVQGVRFDARGTIVGYWLFDEHPGSGRGALKSKLYAAADVAHAFAEDRTGQSRGVPMLHAIELLLKDLGDYADAQLARQKIAAAFCVFERDLSADVPADPNASSTPRTRDLQTGAIIQLPAGKTIEVPDMPSVEGFDAFVSGMLRAAAAGCDLPFELLTGDLSRVNFSSARVGLLPFHGALDDFGAEVIVDGILNPIWRWVTEAAVLRGLKGWTLDAEPPEWIGPEKPMLDPQKETAALIARVRSFVTSLPRALRERGVADVRKHLVECREGFKLLDELGLIGDLDARWFGPVAAGPGPKFEKSKAATAAAATKPNDDDDPDEPDETDDPDDAETEEEDDADSK